MRRFSADPTICMASDSDALAKEISRLKVTWDMKATLFLECTCTYGFIKYSTFIGRVNVPPPRLVAFELLLVYSQLRAVDSVEAAGGTTLYV